jgi:hypothetical protein
MADVRPNQRREILLIKVSMTEKFAGVSVAGDIHDFRNLVDVFHDLSIDETDIRNQCYLNMSIRTLGLCYDIRHALMGEREVILSDNGVDEDIMRLHSLIATESNVYYSCNYLYPETCYVMISLNALIRLRTRKLVRKRYEFEPMSNPFVAWDGTIAAIRGLQSAFSSCVEEALTPNSHSRWLKLMNNDYRAIEDMSGQYLDTLNVEYLSYSPEKRQKNLLRFAKRISEYRSNKVHEQIRRDVQNAALKFNCSPEQIRVEGLEYPAEIDW